MSEEKDQEAVTAGLNDFKDALGRNMGGRLDAEEFSLRQAVGGWRGMVESIGPTLVFVVAFVAGWDVIRAGAVSLGFAVGLIIARLIGHSSIMQAFAGFWVVIIGVLWAMFSGKGENYFLMSLIINAVYASVILVSILARFPVIGLLVGWFRAQGLSWRTDPRLKADRQAYYAVTIIWLGVFLLRLAVKTPLYLGGNVPWLGTFQILLGLPLFALALYLSWLLLRRTHGKFLDSGLPNVDTSDTGAADVPDSASDTTDTLDDAC